ncbi:MAG: hypothetical protein E7557_05285 [Ruminococcaceae bacterium]|nr:hypothetical protein [Oscillospiraceae bacterium]
MKKSKLTKVLAIVLALTLVFSTVGATTASAASLIAAPTTLAAGGGNILTSFLDTLLRIVFDWFASLFPNGPGFVQRDDANIAAENFYEGTTGRFNTQPDANAKWYLGYSNASLVPDDVTNGEYYIGGYIAPENAFTNVVEGVIDDMKVRCIALKDGANGETVLFGTIDCIGITNGDIRDIRALLEDFAAENNIVSINVASTHCHSCIDTEGLWTNNLVKLLTNGINSGTGNGKDLQQGTNPKYMEFLKDTVAEAFKEAFYDMKAGTLTYAQKDIGRDYFNNKNRPSSNTIMSELNRFVFTPDDSSYRPTMIINIAAHPDVAGLPTSSNSGREISGDYVYYCGELLDKAGYNFMFFNGAIAGIYMSRSITGDGVDTPKRYHESMRYGYEIARMALALTMTEAEIKADPLLNCADEVEKYGAGKVGEKDNGYSLWYKTYSYANMTDENGESYRQIVAIGDWVRVSETVVEPYLNLAIKRVEVPVSNDLIQAVGKLNMANYDVFESKDIHGKKIYTTFTEIGYIEFGSKFKAVMLPGEICQDLIVGGSSVDMGVTGEPFTHSIVRDIFGSGTMCFGLMNDAIGYVVPDNDYTMGDPANHYHELISLGQYVASTLMDGLEELKEEIDAR